MMNYEEVQEIRGSDCQSQGRTVTRWLTTIFGLASRSPINLPHDGFLFVDMVETSGKNFTCVTFCLLAV